LIEQPIQVDYPSAVGGNRLHGNATLVAVLVFEDHRCAGGRYGFTLAANTFQVILIVTEMETAIRQRFFRCGVGERPRNQPLVNVTRIA